MGNINSTHLSSEQVSELIKATSFSKRELQNWHKSFLKDYPSGLLDRNDFQGIFKQYFPFGDSKKFADHVFNLFDVNQDGVVDFQEYMILVSLFTVQPTKDRIDWLFKMHDIDEDGLIGRAELLYLIQSSFGCIQDIHCDDPEVRVNELLDDSLVLSREEFELKIKDYLDLF